jgi:hypothetical protein
MRRAGATYPAFRRYHKVLDGYAIGASRHLGVKGIFGGITRSTSRRRELFTAMEAAIVMEGKGFIDVIS